MKKLALCLLLFVIFCSAFAHMANADHIVLEANGTQQWYRGNLHTHTLWSDGDDYPEMVVQFYKDHGYDFLALSDHNLLQNTERWTAVDDNKGGRVAYDKLVARFPEGWVEERTNDDGKLEVRLKKHVELVEKFNEPGEFLLIQSEEITDRFQNGPVHMNATNIQEALPPLGGDSIVDTMQNTVNAVIAQRERTKHPILIHLNHPNFHYAITAEELMRVHGENFFEVYNGHPSVNNNGNDLQPSTEKIWDIILTRRIDELGMPLMYGMATDDSHSYHSIPSRGSEPGRGWVMVLAEELNPESLIASLEAGKFYASSGVSLAQVVVDDQGMTVEVDGESDVDYTIEFIGTLNDYDRSSEPVVDDDGNERHITRRYSDDLGKVLKRVEGTSGRYEFGGRELYVRARVTADRKHPNPSEIGDLEQAWTQPVVGPGAPRASE